MTRRAKGKKVANKVSMYDESETPNNPHEGKIEVGPNFKAVSKGNYLPKKPQPIPELGLTDAPTDAEKGVNLPSPKLAVPPHQQFYSNQDSSILRP